MGIYTASSFGIPQMKCCKVFKETHHKLCTLNKKKITSGELNFIGHLENGIAAGEKEQQKH